MIFVFGIQKIQLLVLVDKVHLPLKLKLVNSQYLNVCQNVKHVQISIHVILVLINHYKLLMDSVKNKTQLFVHMVYSLIKILMIATNVLKVVLIVITNKNVIFVKMVMN